MLGHVKLHLHSYHSSVSDCNYLPRQLATVGGPVRWTLEATDDGVNVNLASVEIRIVLNDLPCVRSGQDRWD